MKSIGARDRSDVNNTAGRTTVFGGEIASDHAKLLHRIERNCLPNCGRKVIDVFNTIEKNTGGRRTHTVDGVSGAAPAAGIGSDVT